MEKYILSKSHHFFDILRYCIEVAFFKKPCCSTKQSIHPWHLISILWDGLLSIFPTATTTFSSFSLATSALTAAALTRPLMEDGSHVAFPSTAGSISCCAETAVVVRRPRQPQHHYLHTGFGVLWLQRADYKSTCTSTSCVHRISCLC